MTISGIPLERQEEPPHVYWSVPRRWFPGGNTVISPESMRNALREMLTQKGLPMNRKRLHDEDQLAVEFKAFPDADAYADDFLFGFMVVDNDAIKKKNKGKPAKRDSVLRMNLAVALTPYRFDATFHQSPLGAAASRGGAHGRTGVDQEADRGDRGAEQRG